MGRGVTRIGVAGAFWISALGFLSTATPAAEADEIPPPLAPFEYLIGGWKGTGIPQANKLKGWPEAHTWAWKFAKGKPVAMTVEVKGGKALARGQLTFDADADRYLLAATDAAGKAVDYTGTFDKAARTLTLDRVAAPGSKDKERLKLRLNGNQIRYLLVAERKEAGAPQFAAVVESGLTKDGESLGGNAAANDGPKCIVTGGTATLNVSFEGKSYPLCCTGCRDEFNDNPQKYVKKAALRAEVASKSDKPAPASRARDDGSFDGTVDESMPARKAAVRPKSDAPAARPKADEDVADAPAAKPTKAPVPGKAASLLKQAQALEKSGNARAALGYYRRIVADYPDAPQAKTAAAKVKELVEE